MKTVSNWPLALSPCRDNAVNVRLPEVATSEIDITQRRLCAARCQWSHAVAPITNHRRQMVGYFPLLCLKPLPGNTNMNLCSIEIKWDDKY